MEVEKDRDDDGRNSMLCRQIVEIRIMGGLRMEWKGKKEQTHCQRMNRGVVCVGFVGNLPEFPSVLR